MLIKSSLIVVAVLSLLTSCDYVDKSLVYLGLGGNHLVNNACSADSSGEHIADSTLVSSPNSHENGALPKPLSDSIISERIGDVIKVLDRLEVSTAQLLSLIHI